MTERPPVDVSAEMQKEDETQPVLRPRIIGELAIDQVRLLYKHVNETEGLDMVPEPVDKSEVLGMLDLFARMHREPAEAAIQTERLLRQLEGTPPHVIAAEAGVKASTISNNKIRASRRIGKHLRQVFAGVTQPDRPHDTEEDWGLAVLEVLPEDSLRHIFGMLSDRQAEVLRLRFNERNEPVMTQREVADYLGVTQSTIRDIERNVWKRFPEFHPQNITREAKKPRSHIVRQSYELAGNTYMVTARQLQVMKMRFDEQGGVKASREEVAETLGVSAANIGKLERSVFERYPEIIPLLDHARIEKIDADLRIVPPPTPSLQAHRNEVGGYLGELTAADIRRLYEVDPEAITDELD